MIASTTFEIITTTEMDMDTKLVVSNNNSTKINEEPAECPVCYESINNEKNNYCKTVCGHSFCFTCIATTMQTKNSCPICRQALFTPPNVHNMNNQRGVIQFVVIEDNNHNDNDNNNDEIFTDELWNAILQEQDRQEQDRRDRQEQDQIGRQQTVTIQEQQNHDYTVQTVIHRILNTTRTNRDETRNILLNTPATAPPTTTGNASTIPAVIPTVGVNNRRPRNPIVEQDPLQRIQSMTNRTHFNTISELSPYQRHQYFIRFPERETRYNLYTQRQRDAYNLH